MKSLENNGFYTSPMQSVFDLDAGIEEEEKQRLLHCVVVGGGPTGVEFSGELSDFIVRDVRQRYAHVKDYIHVTLIEVCLVVSSIIYVIQPNRLHILPWPMAQTSCSFHCLSPCLTILANIIV